MIKTMRCAFLFVLLMATLAHARVLQAGNVAQQQHQHANGSAARNNSTTTHLESSDWTFDYELTIARKGNWRAFIDMPPNYYEANEGCGEYNQYCFCKFIVDPDQGPDRLTRFVMQGKVRGRDTCATVPCVTRTQLSRAPASPRLVWTLRATSSFTFSMLTRRTGLQTTTGAAPASFTFSTHGAGQTPGQLIAPASATFKVACHPRATNSAHGIT